jgi:hypothetical protein
MQPEARQKAANSSASLSFEQAILAYFSLSLKSPARFAQAKRRKLGLVCVDGGKLTVVTVGQRLIKDYKNEAI